MEQDFAREISELREIIRELENRIVALETLMKSTNLNDLNTRLSALEGDLRAVAKFLSAKSEKPRSSLTDEIVKNVLINILTATIIGAFVFLASHKLV